MHITFVTSFSPRKCGIANYSRDLTLTIEKQGHTISVAAMENETVPNSYSIPVNIIIRQKNQNDYKKAARLINSSSTDIVHLQHEFGIFGGEDGEYILDFARRLNKPFILTLHTVLHHPSIHRKYVVQELSKLSCKIIVMEKVAENHLIHVYGIDPKHVTIISHGAPVINMNKAAARKRLGLGNNFILFANNLLSRNKGIEYAIDAVAKAVIKVPNLTFLFIGETHPVVKVNEGEMYRNELLLQVNKLGIEKNVIFVNNFLPLNKLKLYLAAADVYITPYLDPQQVTSGTLSYAIGAGKACIATKYIYANDLLGNNRGLLVPFRNSKAIATAIVDLYQHPKKRNDMEKKIRGIRSTMQWSKVANKHTQLYSDAIKKIDSTFYSSEYLNESSDIPFSSALSNRAK